MGYAREQQAPQTQCCAVLALWLKSDILFLLSYVQKWKSQVLVGIGGEHGKQHVVGESMQGQIFGHRSQRLGPWAS